MKRWNVAAVVVDVIEADSPEEAERIMLAKIQATDFDHYPYDTECPGGIDVMEAD